eukprot:11830685-Alexandrium_andersonii.AAC.1
MQAGPGLPFGLGRGLAGTRLLRLPQQVEDSPNAVAAEARAAALAIELLLQAAIPGPRVTIAGDCTPV